MLDRPLLLQVIMGAKRLYFRSEAREKVLTLLLAEATLTEVPSRHRKESEPAESLEM